MRVIYEKELRSYFTGLTGYLFIAFLLFFTGVYSIVLNFSSFYPNFEYVITNLSFVFMVLVPVLTMRSFAEERAQHSDQLLYSLPLKMPQIVFGKYFAMVTVFLVPIAVMCVYPLILRLYGEVDLLTAYSSIFAFFLLGCALMAIGLFISSLTDNQIVAAVITFLVLLFCYMVTSIVDYVSPASLFSFTAFTVVFLLLAGAIYFVSKNVWLAVVVFAVCEIPLAYLYLFHMITLAGAFQNFLGYLAIFSRTSGFINGVFDLTAVVYFLSIAGLFLFFTVSALEKRRWN